jgi:rod shape-determining protein MreC
MLISDARSSIPVESLKTGLRSMLQGNGVDRPLSLMFISKTEKIESGDVLISSGAGSGFPKGYPVGKISEVVNRAGDQFLSISVAPMAQLDRERFALLVGDANA